MTHRYAKVIQRFWYVALAVGVLGGFLGWGLSQLTVHKYTSTSSLFFSLRAGDSASDLNQGATYTQSQMLSFSQLATSPIVLSPVISHLGLDTSPAKLAQLIDVSAPQNTVVLTYSVTDTSATSAREIAAQVAKQLTTAVENVAPRDAKDKPTITATVIEPATLPRYASSPNTRLNTLGGLVLGLLVGALALVAVEALERRVRTPQIAAEVSGLPMLGSTRTLSSSSMNRYRVMLDAPLSAAAEAYRQLRSNFEYVMVGAGNPLVVLTSALASEGKSTTALNFALALAESRQRVLLIDADLRRPSIAKYAGVETEPGLSSVLIGRATFEQSLHRWGSGTLDLLTAGPTPPNPSEMLSSPAMLTLLASVRDRYDVVLIDTAPVLEFADATIVGAVADGVIIVADRTKVTRGYLAAAVEVISHAGVRAFGVVLNRVSPPRRKQHHIYGEPTMVRALVGTRASRRIAPEGTALADRRREFESILEPQSER